MKDIYVVNCCRTAIGSFGGSLKDIPAADLGATVIREALSRAGVKPEQVDEVMFGCILTAGLGQNVARQAAIKAGVPTSVPAYTVGMVCGSGMKSVIEAARTIMAGDADIIVAGGTEVYGNARVYGNAEVCKIGAVFWIGAIGSRNRTTTFFRCKDGKIYVSCGCFLGDLEEFSDKVKQTHGDNEHGRVYMLAIEMAKARIVEEKNEVH